MLSPEQIQQLQKQYGAQETPQKSTSSLQTRLDAIDHAAATANDARHAMATPAPETQPKKPGFFQGLIQGVASPFARLGVEAYNVGSGVNKAIHGDVAGGSAELDKTRDLGFLGQTKPTLTNSTNPGIKEGLDIAGQGIELGTDFAGAGAGKDLVKGAGEQTVKQLIKTGAKEGALIGGVQGFGSSLEGDNQSIGKTLTSTIGGAGAGAILGGATGGITGYLKGRPWSSVDQGVKDTWEKIQPKLNATETATARASGNITKKGILQTAELQPTKLDKQMIEVAHPYVSGVKNEEQMIANMRKGIQDHATTLRAGLDQSNAIWSQNNLKGAINAIEKPHLLSGDLEKSFDKTLNVVLDKAQTADKKLSGLLDVRQQFDQEVAKQYPNLYNGSDSMSAIKQAVKATRQAINDLIEKKLPNGMTADGIPFKQSLKTQSLLYDAIDNVAAKGDKIGSNILSRAAKTPIGKAIEYGVGGTAVFEGAKKILGK